MIFSSDELASDDTSSLQERCVFRSTLTSEAVLFSCFYASFLLISLLSFVLPEPNIDLKFLSMVLYTWTNISISNWQFFNTLLSSKLLRVMLNSFCSNNFWSSRFQSFVVFNLHFWSTWWEISSTLDFNFDHQKGGDCWNKMCLTLPLKVLRDNKVLKTC